MNSPAPEPKEALKTKFRRKKPNEDEQNEAAEKEREELAKLAKKPHLPGLRSLYGSKASLDPAWHMTVLHRRTAAPEEVTPPDSAHHGALPKMLKTFAMQGAANPPIVLVDGYNVMLQWVARVKQGHSLHGLPHLLPAGKTLDAIDEPLGFQQMRNRYPCCPPVCPRKASQVSAHTVSCPGLLSHAFWVDSRSHTSCSWNMLLWRSTGSAACC